MLGWDVTDYGLGQFYEKGITLFTIRNGNQQMREKYPKPYAEKLLVSREGQMCTMHFHWKKSEDIINRGGGVLMMQLYNATDADQLAETDVTVSCDGVRLTVPAGTAYRRSAGVEHNVVNDGEAAMSFVEVELKEAPDPEPPQR